MDFAYIQFYSIISGANEGAIFSPSFRRGEFRNEKIASASPQNSISGIYNIL